ncbi:hypothetical protein BX616_001468, partial [Lobosporangium transversale]
MSYTRDPPAPTPSLPTSSPSHRGSSSTSSTDLKSKHLSTPYNMQSISTDSLPTLFGATSLRRTNSNVVSRSRTPRTTRTTSPTSISASISSTSIDNTATTTSLQKATTLNAPLASVPVSSSSAKPAKVTTATATTIGRRPVIDVIPESFEIDAGHARRSSSWDIMDMLAIDQLRQWMVCFCVVNFDLEKGQGKSNTQ